MNEHQVKYYFFGVVFLVAFGCLLYLVNHKYLNQVGVQQNDTHPKITFNQNELTLIERLQAPDGTIYGDIYVTSLHPIATGSSTGSHLDAVFTALYVTKEVNNKNIILYKINSEGFFNTKGKDVAIRQGDFYGYQFARVSNDSFVLHLVSEEGEGNSDDATIVWNPDKDIFEMYRTQVD